MNQFDVKKMRLDKWLWAARFFRSRELAKQAIEHGHVLADLQRVKPAREIAIGTRLDITRGDEQICLQVVQLSDQRRAAPLARELYEETKASIEQRELAREKRRLASAMRGIGPVGRPDRRDRRALKELKQILDED